MPGACAPPRQRTQLGHHDHVAMALDSRVPGPPALHRSLWHLWVIGRRGYPLTRNRAEMIVQIDIGGIGISWALFFLLEVINEHWDVPISRRVAAAGGGPGSRRGRSLEVAPSPPIPRNTALHRRFARLGHGRWPVRVGGLRCKRERNPRPTMRESRPFTGDSAVTVGLVGTQLSRACDHAPPSASERPSSTGVRERVARPRWIAQHRRPRGTD